MARVCIPDLSIFVCKTLLRGAVSELYSANYQAGDRSRSQKLEARTHVGSIRDVSLRTVRSALILLLRDCCALRRACQSTSLLAAPKCMQANAAGRRD